ncbi:MAG: hypothetical protein LC641_07405 [Spirochaeta sp.]|nr:hypothetical protein [Spirochaeta sp.]
MARQAHIIVVFLVVIAIFVAPTLIAQQQCEAPVSPPDMPELLLQNTVPPNEVTENIGEPMLVDKYVGKPEGEGEIMVSGHMHAVFSTPLQGFVSAAQDLEAHPEFLGRLVEAEILCSDNDSYVRTRQELSFRVLGFGSNYEHELHYFITDEVESSGEFTIVWKLAESLDRKHTDIYGGWYFREVNLGGRPHTYVAYKTISVFRENQFGLRTALNSFGERDIRNVILDIDAEADKRSR